RHYDPPPALPSFPTRRSSDLCCWSALDGPGVAGKEAGKVPVISPGLLVPALAPVPERDPFGLKDAPPPAPVIKPRPTQTLAGGRDRKSTRLNSSHVAISYAVF